MLLMTREVVRVPGDLGEQLADPEPGLAVPRRNFQADAHQLAAAEPVARTSRPALPSSSQLGLWSKVSTCDGPPVHAEEDDALGPGRDTGAASGRERPGRSRRPLTLRHLRGQPRERQVAESGGGSLERLPLGEREQGVESVLTCLVDRIRLGGLRGSTS